MLTIAIAAALAVPARPVVIDTVIAEARAHLRDPHSMEDLRVCEAELTNGGWKVLFSMNARNGFGGMAGTTVIELEVGENGGFFELDARLIPITRNCPAVPL